MSGMKNDGGQAFPQVFTDHNGEVTSSEGMSLRDYFAGQALPSLLITMADGNLKIDQERKSNQYDTAKHAYAIADAMIAEREK